MNKSVSGKQRSKGSRRRKKAFRNKLREMPLSSKKKRKNRNKKLKPLLLKRKTPLLRAKLIQIKLRNLPSLRKTKVTFPRRKTKRRARISEQ